MQVGQMSKTLQCATAKNLAIRRAERPSVPSLSSVVGQERRRPAWMLVFAGSLRGYSSIIFLAHVP